MALSDYLTDDEWDACFYASHGINQAENFGASMHKTIDKLLEKGYVFRGLDAQGNKAQQIPSGNSVKVCIWLGNPYNVNVLEVIKNGRKFIKEHCPELLSETDEDFEQQIKEAEDAQTKKGA